MAYDVSALAAYTDETRGQLITDSVIGSRSAQLLTKQSGIKYKEALNIADVAITVADGSSCGFTAAGNDTLTQRVIEVTPLKVNKEWCPRDFEQKWAQVLLNAGSDYSDHTPEEIFVNKIVQEIQYDNEKTIWQGKNSPTISGIVEHVDALSGSVVLTSTGVAWATNEITILKQLYQDIPEAIIDAEDFRVFMGRDYARDLRMALRDENLFHYMMDEDENSFTFPGTNMKIEVVSGLTSQSRIIAARTSNLYVGCDLENEEENFKFWYSQDDDVVRMRCDWKLGTQVAFPGEIVVYQGS